MKIWSVKSTVYYWSLVLLIFLVYILPATLAAFPSGTRPVMFQFVALVTYVKYPNLDLIINIWKRKKRQRKKKEWIENFKIENSYLKLCHKFRAFIRCMKAAFYRPDYQKILMCPLIKRLGRAFVSKHAAEPLKHSARLLRIYEKTKSSAECLESSYACLCYGTAHAVPISPGNL